MTLAPLHCRACGVLLIVARKGASSYCPKCDQWSGPPLRPRDYRDLGRDQGRAGRPTAKRGVLR
jgi:hypothetical protein